MKQEIKLPKKVLIAIYSVWVLVIMTVVIFFTERYLKFRKETERFVEERMSGKIVKVDDLGRGTVSLVILANKNKHIKTTSLSIAYEIKKFGIREGDSLLKNANSEKINFYRIEGGSVTTIGYAEL